MLQDASDFDGNVVQIEGSDEYMTVFFVFDSVLENGGMHSQTLLELFKDIQNESLQ